MCSHGDTVFVEVTIPAALSHTGTTRNAVKPVDRCLAPLIVLLNAAGFRTANCCCGHGIRAASIVFHDGTEIRATD